MGIIDVNGLSFKYGNEEKEALSDINFSVNKGEFIVICGRSGSGKSTLLSQFKPAIAPFGRKEGNVLFNGRDIDSYSEIEQAVNTGFVFQNPELQIVTDKVWHELAFGLENIGKSSQEVRMRTAEMASYFGLEKIFHSDTDKLSLGQKQLLNLAAIMAMNPQVLVLDEPTSLLDPIAAANFIDTLRRINQETAVTVIMTEHRLDEVMCKADRVIFMDNGKIICDSPVNEMGSHMKDIGKMEEGLPVPMRFINRFAKEKENYIPVSIAGAAGWFEKHAEDFKMRDIYENDYRSDNILELRDVWFRYEKNGKDILKGLNLGIRRGECYCILGGNGSGKSTTLSIISNIFKPYSGKVMLNGKKTCAYSKKQLYTRYIGVVPQNPRIIFSGETVREELNQMNAKEKTDEMLTLMELTDVEMKNCGDISGGEQQRLALAKILLTDTDIIIMDEPTKGMDGTFKKIFAEIIRKLKNEGKTVIMVSHDVEFCAVVADRCGLFFDGIIVSEGNTRNFLASNSFYTTAVNKICKQHFEQAIVMDDMEMR